MKAIDDLIAGTADIAVYRAGIGWTSTVPDAPVVLSGSFRPLHRAHRKLLQVGHEISGEPACAQCFELSIANVEKPSLIRDEILTRSKQFQQEGDTLIVTREATFLGKSRILPRATFVVGYDTAVRLFDARFYEHADGNVGVLEAMRTIRDRGSNFVVGGRHDDNGRFMTWEDYDCPAEFQSMFTSIPASDFSDAISSTKVRESR